MLRLSGWRPYQLQCVADAFSTRFETTLTPQTLATESLHCALDETTVLRGSGPLPDAGAHILACFASFGPVSLTRQEGRTVLTARAVVSAFAENALGEMECYEKALDYALPLPADLPEDADAYPECWLSVQDLQCAGAGGALDVSLTVRAEGAVLARQTVSAPKWRTKGWAQWAPERTATLRRSRACAARSAPTPRTFDTCDTATMRVRGPMTRSISSSGMRPCRSGTR